MVQGLKEFERKFNAIPEAMRKAVAAELEEVAHDLVEQMQAIAPYDDGELQASIGWTWGDAPAGSLTIGTVNNNQYATMRITIYAGGGEAFYARFQEFGTVNMPANPFFYPVWRANKKKVKSRVGKAVSRAIRTA